MMRNSGDGTLARRGDASEAQLRMKRDAVLVIACGALGRELHAIRCANGWDHLRIRCLAPELHLRPAQIAPRLRAELERARGSGGERGGHKKYRRIFIGYADCGSYGGIDRVLEDYPGVERLPGLHCYEFFSGAELFERLADDEPGTFYLTDFLVRFFDRLVVETLQLDRHPDLFDTFFGNYRRLIYLSQTRDPVLLAGARAAAARLGLEFAHVHTGYGALETRVVRIAEG